MPAWKVGTWEGKLWDNLHEQVVEDERRQKFSCHGCGRYTPSFPHAQIGNAWCGFLVKTAGKGNFFYCPGCKARMAVSFNGLSFAEEEAEKSYWVHPPANDDDDDLHFDADRLLEERKRMEALLSQSLGRKEGEVRSVSKDSVGDDRLGLSTLESMVQEVEASLKKVLAVQTSLQLEMLELQKRMDQLAPLRLQDPCLCSDGFSTAAGTSVQASSRSTEVDPKESWMSPQPASDRWTPREKDSWREHDDQRHAKSWEGAAWKTSSW